MEKWQQLHFEVVGVAEQVDQEQVDQDALTECFSTAY